MCRARRSDRCKRTRWSAKRTPTGSTLAEAVTGIVLLLIVVLGLLDLGVVVLAGDTCGNVAKQAARAASNAGTQAEAQAAVVDVASKFPPTNMYKDIKVVMDRFDNSERGVVHVNCSMTVVLPVSVPLLKLGPTLELHSQATEPIVGIAPPPPPQS